MSASKTNEATPVTLCADSVAKALSADSQTTWRNVTGRVGATETACPSRRYVL